jgi:septum formation protein
MSCLVLASASPRRQEILKQLGLDFRVVPSNIEEKMPKDMAPANAAVYIALQKAKDVADRSGNGSLVIGADTIVVLDNEIMGKPEDQVQAFYMLDRLSGRQHTVITGLAVVDRQRDIEITGFEETKVYMRKLSPDRIERYIRTGEPYDKAGAYAVQGKASVFIDRIEGCYFNVVGLPISKLDAMLYSIGVDLFGDNI